MITRSCGALIIVAIIATTSACGSIAPPSSGSIPTTGPTSATTETTTEEGAATTGPCESLLDPAEVATILGAPGVVLVGTADPLLAVVGGFECEYTFDTSDQETDDEEEDDSPYTGTDRVYLAVAPTSVSTPSAIASSLISQNCAPATDRGIGCFATVSVGGWWYSLMVESSTSATVQKSSFEQITTQVERALGALTPPGQVDGVKPFDCKSVDTGGLTVHSSRTLALTYVGSEMYGAAFLLAGPEMCEFTLASGEAWDFTVYPGGAAAFDQCRFAATGYDPNSSPFEVEGVDSVYELSNTGDEDRYCATDGISLISVFYSYDDEDGSDEDPADVLGALLPPTFAAASTAAN
jgi:hypothetical protein